MKTDNIQALKDALADFSKAETEYDNYINRDCRKKNRTL